MAGFLSEIQRNDLHKALISYLANDAHIDPSLVQQLQTELGIADPGQDAHTLERKWAALVRLQRKLLDTEQQNSQLKLELKEAREALANGQVEGTAAGGGAPTASGTQSVVSSRENWLPSWPPKHTMRGHRGRVTCVAFHPEWSLVASGSDDGSVKIWDYEHGEIEQTIRAHTRGVLGITFSPISKQLVTCSADLSIRVWDPTRQFANTLTLVGHDHTVSSVDVVVDPRTKKEYIVSASRDKTIRVWELAMGFSVRVIRTHTDWVRTLSCTGGNLGASVDNKEVEYILSAGSDRTLRLTPLLENMAGSQGGGGVFEGHTNVIECCSVAPRATSEYIKRHYECQPNEIIFASGGRDSKILIWASGNKEGPILKLTGHDNWVQGLAFHPNGRYLVSVSDDKTMKIWDLTSAKVIKSIPAHDHFVTSIAWHNKSIATGSVDQSVRIWSD